jgi:6-pyruvoyltetrahydropterin/6-carboxytetrahydropterin synthase
MLVDLSRSVRFNILAQENPLGNDTSRAVNGFAGAPAADGLSRFYECDVTCRGRVDPRTGYFMDIKEIDRAVRDRCLPLISSACTERRAFDPLSLLPQLCNALTEALHGTVRTIRWRLSPWYSLEMEPSSMHRAVIREMFEFSAAHRLHSPHLSDEENRRVFGKCNNPRGHGHNYKLQVSISVPVPASGAVLSADELEQAVTRAVIDRFDHKHLNEECPEFGGGSSPSPQPLNPSVENIAKVCFDLLAPEVAQLASGTARLHEVTVWETDKTSCRYPVRD